jgi:alanine-glyoxylate transaminase/serine-glyoxylate transaminase/serine-pyruvate transaminase
MTARYSDQRIPGNRFLHSPGPTHVPEAVQNALRRQPMDLGDPRLDETIAACESGLKQLLGTRDADVFMYAANGHGAWEATVVNLLAPGQKVLIAGTGHFSESWAVQTEAMGVVVVRTPYVEGNTIDLEAVEATLCADTQHQIVALFVVHTDTASGTTNDLQVFRQLLDDLVHPALYVVDVVATLGAAPFAMDALGANVVVGASQKGLMTPPGLGFCAVDAKALAVSDRNPAPRFYWDWRKRKSDLAYRKFCGTPPQSLLFGLEAALGLIFLEGVEAVLARHSLLARATQAAVAAWSEQGAMQFLCKLPDARSVSVTSVLVSPGLNPDTLRRIAREQFQVSIAGGLGPFAGRVFRIGHLGDLNAAMLLGCLGGVEGALVSMGVPVGRDGVRRAVEVLARAHMPAEQPASPSA